MLYKHVIVNYSPEPYNKTLRETEEKEMFKQVTTLRVEDLPFQIAHSNAKQQGIEISNLASTVLENIYKKDRKFFPSTSVEIFSVMSERDLPSTAYGCVPRSIRATYKNALKQGFCMCPTSLALYFLLRAPRGLAGDHYVIAHRPVSCPCEQVSSGKRNYVLTIRDRNEPSSRGGINVWSADWNSHLGDGVLLLFCKQTPDLIAMGLTRLGK